MKKCPIKGFEELYEIYENGDVYSKKRVIKGKDGINYPFKRKKLNIIYNPKNNSMSVDLWKNNKAHRFYQHRLLGEHFIPNPENKPEINHIDGNRCNNSLNNLEWVTSSENKQHAINTGLKVYTNRLTKKDFLDCLNDVINGESYLSLTKRVPYKVPFLSTKLRQIAKENNLEHLLDESLYKQKIQRARINGSKNNRTNK